MKPSPSLLAACIASLGLLSTPLLAAERSLVFEARPGGPDRSGRGSHLEIDTTRKAG
jgi:hypothetical protein